VRVRIIQNRAGVEVEGLYLGSHREDFLPVSPRLFKAAMRQSLPASAQSQVHSAGLSSLRYVATVQCREEMVR
jgi:hypothetical protein